MSGRVGIKYSFSLRGLSAEVTEEHLTNFFASTIGAVVASVRMVSNAGGHGAYVNLSSGDLGQVLANNGTKPPFNKGLVLSIRQQYSYQNQS